MKTKLVHINRKRDLKGYYAYKSWEERIKFIFPKKWSRKKRRAARNLLKYRTCPLIKLVRNPELARELFAVESLEAKDVLFT